VLLELKAVSKSFGSTRALDGVSFDLRAGEVHVLAGENGAGKSTLIKILSGVYPDYAGELVVAGVAQRFASPVHARRAGIATIHQELSLVPCLSVADNFLLASEGRAFALPRRKELFARARELLEAVGLALDPEVRVEALTLGDRQLVEIARALGQSARVLVMDEPTSALTEPEVERLFEQLSLFREAGTGILYISHRMEEIYRLADRITVLRDGRHQLTREKHELSREELVHAMVGKGVLALPRARRAQVQASPPLLDVRNLGNDPPGALAELSFTLGRGEILGLAGLKGSGTTEALYALFGGPRAARGTLTLEGRAYAPAAPRAAMKRGVALLPSDRARSVFPELRVRENATLSALRRFSRGGWVERAREQAAVRERAGKVALKAASLEAPARALSGGNQQKLALLRCLLLEPCLLLLDDPTRGVDVGARAEIYELLGALAARGVGVVLASTDLDELCEVCDRVLVLFRGRLFATLERERLTRESLVPKVMGAEA
jgi:ribose transport system ATP-binding protein